jgi:hypothetical protein
VWAVCLAALGPLQGGSQSQSGGLIPGAPAHLPLTRQYGDRQDEMGGSSPFEEAKRMRALNAERQKSLVADTDKLLLLAHQLNEGVAAGDKDALSPLELRKVAEIEKLAHNVKEKMGASVLATPVSQRPFLPLR